MSHVTQKFKLPSEELSIPIDFSVNALTGGELIVSAVAEARDKADGSDVLSTFVPVGPTNTTTVVTVKIHGGTKGQKIEVDVLATGRRLGEQRNRRESENRCSLHPTSFSKASWTSAGA